MPLSSKPRPPTTKVAKGPPSIRANLPKHVLEIKEEEEIEIVEKEPLPPRRIPYTIHITTQLSGHRHIHEDSVTQDYIKSKITHSMERMEGLIKHVEVRVRQQEHFHKDKPNHKKVVSIPQRADDLDEEDGVAMPKNSNTDVIGAKKLAPFALKLVISLHNGHEVIYDNPEKHAQPTLTEAVDAAVDGIKGLLRAEKEKDISMHRAKKEEKGSSDVLALDDDGEMPDAGDAEVLELYEKVEAKMEEEAGAKP